jgi:hypothetical protein
VHRLDLPARTSARFTATAQPSERVHRWEVRVLGARSGETRLTFASKIGGRDLRQAVDIPGQDVDCRVEVSSRHETAGGWIEDRPSISDDDPSRLSIGFSDQADPVGQLAEVLISFVFALRNRKPVLETTNS